MFCHKCGNQPSEGAIFCQKCGARLTNEGAPPQEEAPVAPLQTQAYDDQEDKPKKTKSNKLLIGLGVIAGLLLIVLIGTSRGNNATPPASSADGSNAASPATVPPGEDVFKDILDIYANSVLYTDCAYALYDIDGNGIDELLVRYNDGADDYTKIYTYANGKANEIGEFWSRCWLMLDGNGNIYSDGDNGAANSVLELARISDDGTALITTEIWESDEYIYKHNSKNGLEIISEKEYFDVWRSVNSVTEGFVDSLNWQPIPSAAGTKSVAVNSNLGEVLYNGTPLCQFLFYTAEELKSILGAPDYEDYGYEGYYYEYGDIEFIYFDYDMAYISVSNPGMLTLAGISLDKNRSELIAAFGEPYSFELCDDNGYMMDSNFLVDNSLNATVKPQRRVDGNVAFEYSNSSYFDLYYEPNWLAEDIMFRVFKN